MTQNVANNTYRGCRVEERMVSLLQLLPSRVMRLTLRRHVTMLPAANIIGFARLLFESFFQDLSASDQALYTSLL